MDLGAVDRLSATLHAAGDDRKAAWWQNYVKGSAPFLGVPMATVRREATRWWASETEAPAVAKDSDAAVELACALIRQPYTEEKLAGTLLLTEVLIPQGVVACRRDLPRFARLFDEGHLADWNVVDWFSVKVLDALIRREREPAAEQILAWSGATVLWRSRASVVAFVAHTGERAWRDGLIAACRRLIARPERFAKTAVGWLLRELGHHDEGAVDRFLDEHVGDLTSEVLRNALKHRDTATRDAHRSRMRAGPRGTR